MNVLECANVNKSYKKNKPVLTNLNITIPEGRIVGLLGPNGCGKSTLIKMIAGILQPNSGEIGVSGNPVGEKSCALISYLPERTYFSNSMKVRDIIKFFTDFYADFDVERATLLLNDLGIDVNASLKTLSKGTKEKVQLILVMSRNAKLYLLDEPIAGVDPAARDYILRTIISNYNENATVLLSTHLISDIENILDEVIFIKNGMMVLQDTVENIRMNKKKSVDAYFREVFAC